MTDFNGEKRRPFEPVGLQVPELLSRSAGALGVNCREPKSPGLIEELGIDREALRLNYLEQLALEGIELTR